MAYEEFKTLFQSWSEEDKYTKQIRIYFGESKPQRAPKIQGSPHNFFLGHNPKEAKGITKNIVMYVMDPSNWQTAKQGEWIYSQGNDYNLDQMIRDNRVLAIVKKAMKDPQFNILLVVEQSTEEIMIEYGIYDAVITVILRIVWRDIVPLKLKKLMRTRMQNLDLRTESVCNKLVTFLDQQYKNYKLSNSASRLKDKFARNIRLKRNTIEEECQKPKNYSDKMRNAVGIPLNSYRAHVQKVLMQRGKKKSQ